MKLYVLEELHCPGELLTLLTSTNQGGACNYRGLHTLAPYISKELQCLGKI